MDGFGEQGTRRCADFYITIESDRSFSGSQHMEFIFHLHKAGKRGIHFVWHGDGEDDKEMDILSYITDTSWYTHK